MHGIRNGLLRWLVVMGIVLITCWPNYGVGWLSWQALPNYPVPVVVFDLLWIVVLALALPVALHWFRIVTVLAFLALWGVAIFEVVRFAPSLVSNGGSYVIIAALIAGFLFGWWKIATPLWRWANGIVAVQNTNEPQHHGNDN